MVPTISGCFLLIASSRVLIPDALVAKQVSTSPILPATSQLNLSDSNSTPGTPIAWLNTRAGLKMPTAVPSRGAMRYR